MTAITMLMHNTAVDRTATTTTTAAMMVTGLFTKGTGPAGVAKEIVNGVDISESTMTVPPPTTVDLDTMSGYQSLASIGRQDE